MLRVPGDVAPAAGGAGGIPALRHHVLVLIPLLTAAAVLQAVFIAEESRALDPGSFAALACILPVLGAAGTALQLVAARAAAGLWAGGSGVPGSARALARALAGRAAAGGALLGAVVLVTAGPIAAALRLPSALPVALAGPLLALYAPFPVLLGAIQGERRVPLFGGLVVLEAALRLALSVAARALGVPGAAAPIAGLLAGYALLLPLAASATRGGAGGFPREALAAAARALLPTGVAVVALGLGDVLAVQRALPGSAGGAAYGGAAFLGRASALLAMPFAAALFPAAAATLARGEDPAPLVRRVLLVATGPVLATSLAIAATADPLTALLFPTLPGAAPLVRLLPLATAPYAAVLILAHYGLAVGRPVAAVLAPGLVVEWALFALLGNHPFAVLAALAGTGLALAGALAAAARRRDSTK